MIILSNDCARILVVGGSPEVASSETIRRATAGCDEIVAVDRGLDALIAAGLSCSLFCGDGDTISPVGAAYIEQADFDVERYDPHKDATDLSLALRACSQRWPHAEIVATCVSGGAIDHNLAVLGRLSAWDGFVSIVEDTFDARILHAGDEWKLAECTGRRFSCVPLSPVAEVSESGFRWNIDHAHMELLSDWGVSNVVEGAQAKVSCHDGVLGCWLYR